MENIAEYITSVDRSVANVVVKTHNWYARIVTNEIMASEIAPLIMAALPGKNTTILFSRTQLDAKKVEKKISEIHKNYVDELRQRYAEASLAKKDMRNERAV